MMAILCSPEKVLAAYNKATDLPAFVCWLEENGFKNIGHGLYRTVYKRPTGRFVVKVRKFVNDTEKYGAKPEKPRNDHNRTEAFTATLIAQKHFAKIYLWNDDILIQKFIPGKQECVKGKGKWYSCPRPPYVKGLMDWHSGNHRHTKKGIIVIDLGYGLEEGHKFGKKYELTVKKNNTLEWSKKDEKPEEPKPEKAVPEKEAVKENPLIIKAIIGEPVPANQANDTRK